MNYETTLRGQAELSAYEYVTALDERRVTGAWAIRQELVPGYSRPRAALALLRKYAEFYYPFEIKELTHRIRRVKQLLNVANYATQFSYDWSDWHHSQEEGIQ